jgi:PAS domain S-box-containing protein
MENCKSGMARELELTKQVLEAVTRVNRQVFDSEPPRETFEFLLRTLLDISESEYGFFGHVLIDDNGRPYLKNQAVSNIAWTDDLRVWYDENAPKGLEFRNLNTLFGHVLVTGEPLIANDAPNHPKAHGVPQGHPALRKFLGLPLKIGSRTVGMAGIANRPQGYDIDLIRWLEPLTNTIAQALGSVEQATKRAELEREIRTKEERWNLALLGVGDGVWDWDLTAKKVFFSSRWKAMLGYQDSEIGDDVREWAERVHPEDLDQAEKLVRDHLEGLSPVYECEHRVQKKDGGYIWVLDRGSVVARDSSGAPTRFVGTHVDITAKKAAERELVRAHQAAEEAAQAKSEFLAVMSHEIRTPMNGVIGMTSLLLGTELTAEQRDYVETIRTSGDALLDIINDILDFSKLESGKVEFEQCPVDLRDAAEDVRRLLEPSARTKGLQLKLNVPESPLVVQADAGRVRQVLLNLLSNAIKFTSAGEVALAVRAHDESESAARLVEIEVSDTGIGVPEDKRHRLFQFFSQVDASTTRKYGGTGLGLAICQRLMEHMGGRIEYQPRPGGGSIFRCQLRLPRADAPLGPEPSRATPSKTGRLAGRRVLLAEDNAVNQKVARAMLERLDVQVDCVSNGLEAVQAVRQSPYDIVLMDCLMPELDGYEATRQIRESPDPSSRVPVIALTANVMPSDRERCLEAGMNDFLSKPVHRDALENALLRWLACA